MEYYNHLNNKNIVYFLLYKNLQEFIQLLNKLVNLMLINITNLILLIL